MTQSTLVTRQSTKLDFVIPVSAWQGSYDRLEVWRSQSTPSGPFVALHGDTWLPATLPLGSPTTPPSPAQTGAFITIVGQDLHFLLNEETPIDIVFTGTDPLTLAQVASQIASQSNTLLTSYVVSGQVVVQTKDIGNKISLRCTSGGAAPLLGFDTTTVAFGVDPRILLEPQLEDYSLVDPNGSSSFYYRYRFFNQATRLWSDYSIPAQPVTAALSTSNLLRCYVDLIGLEGNALNGQEVLIGNAFGGTLVDGKAVVGGNISLLTDANGHAELLVPRGAKITVAIAGTDLVRDVTVPTDATVTSLNLLDPSVGTNDVFQVQHQEIDFAVRRSI